uniref:Uncharacterized protein n=1 Tax=Glossina pallidipes TaxID=7398 RepID=A0A1A9ZPU1_GLOPL
MSIKVVSVSYEQNLFTLFITRKHGVTKVVVDNEVAIRVVISISVVVLVAALIVFDVVVTHNNFDLDIVKCKEKPDTGLCEDKLLSHRCVILIALCLLWTFDKYFLYQIHIR